MADTMRTTEPGRWQELLDKVSSITPETLQKFRDQKRFTLLGQHLSIGDKDRYCTVEGMNRQLDEFETRVGLVYYIDESIMGMAKASFIKTWDEQYDDKFYPPEILTVDEWFAQQGSQA